jgi:hypothetical protein
MSTDKNKRMGSPPVAQTANDAIANFASQVGRIVKLGMGFSLAGTVSNPTHIRPSEDQTPPINAPPFQSIQIAWPPPNGSSDRATWPNFSSPASILAHGA